MALCEYMHSPIQLTIFADDIRARRKLVINEAIMQAARQVVRNKGVSLASAAGGATPARTNVPRQEDGKARVRHDAPELTALHFNPFCLLGATMRDDRHRIVELAEEKSLSLDSETCTKARSDLTNPRNRLSAEIAWLPGVSPKRASEFVRIVQEDHGALMNQEGAPPLAEANLMAAAFELLDPGMSTKDWADWITLFANIVEEIDPESVLRDINEDRAVAGFPEVKVLDAIESELAERRRYYKDAIYAAINRLPPAKLAEAVTLAVDLMTDSGESNAPALIDELVDSYELGTQDFLRKEADNALKLVESARQAAPKGEQAVKPLLDRLDTVICNWDKVAQPIQISKKSRGLAHDMSHELAYEIRGLGVYLSNEHGMLDATQRLIKISQGIFAELPEVAAQLHEDAETIEGIFQKRKEAQEQAGQWAVEITFKTELGLVFKDTLAISPHGVQWKDKVFPLETISRVRWGGTRHSVNGIPTGTTYTICFGDHREIASVETNKEWVFSKFVDKLWRAVCVQILAEMLAKMSKGSRFRFGESVVDDLGMEVVKRKFFGSNERIYCKWAQLVIWNGPGTFCVGIKGEEKANVALSYLEVDNVHILEAAIRMLWKKGGPKLSALLEGG